MTFLRNMVWVAAAWIAFYPAALPAQPAPFPLADGTSDATAAIQAELDAAGTTGGVVNLPPGQYLLQGSLHVPPGVCLQGSWQEPHHGSAWKLGTTLLITGGRGQENGPAAIELDASSAVKGMTLLWPEQTWNNIQPYPWAIQGLKVHATVENVTLINAYQGIAVGSALVPEGSLHLIRNVFGCVLRRGISVDNTTDIGRIENVHFNPHYWLASNHPSSNAGMPPPGKGQLSANRVAVAKYLTTNLEAFIFARTDWEYVIDTFVWGARVGYHFVKSPHGACNGQFLGIGADFCNACVQIDAIQNIGLQVTNGEFTAFSGEPNSAIVTSPGAAGAAQFVNCNFWGIKNHSLWMQGKTSVTLADCHFLQTPAGGAVLAENGKLIVQGCTFDKTGPAVILKPGVKAAILLGNLQTGGFEVRNGIGAHARIGLNENP